MTATAAGPTRARALFAQLRPKDWVKNGLVFAPILFAGSVLDLGPLVRVATGAVALSLAASAGYVLNDLRDLDADRTHPVKRHRPLASGALDPVTAQFLGAFLLLLAVGLAATLGTGFLVVVAAYLVLQIFYSLWLKHVLILDVLVIGFFYILRVQAGAIAGRVPASEWLLVATGVLAVFLGLCKRRHELLLMESDADRYRAVLDQYTERFLDAAISLTTSTALITWILYAMAPETVEVHGSRGMLLATPCVFYGLLRYLHLVYTVGEGGQPTELVLTDRGVILAGVAFALVCGFVVYL